MSNNFDPSKLNIDFSNSDNDINNESDDIENKKKEDEIKEKELYTTAQMEKERLEQVSTILTDDTLRPEELKEKDKQKLKITDKEEIDTNIVYDINIKVLTDLLKIVKNEKYDFFVATPYSEYIKIEFKKDSVIKDRIFIKYKEYTNIFIKAKNIAKLNIEDTTNQQK
ncbi:MAG: hypothetical protein U9Q66_02155 [Patescibacteria group bacterium]|nr:hypothetical protein [Patescibacteria group bacterium]